MLRAALVAALAMLALPATASAAQGSASLAVCAPDERAAEFDARMTRVPGTAKMKMRFLLERRKPGSLRYRRVSAPGFSRWTSSQAARYVFTRHVEGLDRPRPPPRAGPLPLARRRRRGDRHRSRVVTLVLAARSPAQPQAALADPAHPHVVRRGRLEHRPQRDRGLRPAAHGRRPGAARRRSASLDPGETRHVNITGPRCTGQAAVVADPLDLIDERREDDNARAARVLNAHLH